MADGLIRNKYAREVEDDVFFHGWILVLRIGVNLFGARAMPSKAIPINPPFD